MEIYEYKLVLIPHADLREKILFIQNAFKEKYNIDSKLISLPQIILARFKQRKAFEERIVSNLRTVAMANPPVKIELKDFGSFPSHTVYINVPTKFPITELVKKIKTYTQRLMKLDADNKPYFPTDAHFTIATRLAPWQYEKGWLELSNKHFTGKFIATSMVLLRRKEGEFRYSAVNSFTFENLPVETTQGNLF